jgi:hypothetical protein
MSLISIHQTHTQKIHDSSNEGWEFWCPQCSYQARYITKNGHEARILEIIDDGDPGVHHTSTSTEYGVFSGAGLSAEDSNNWSEAKKSKKNEIWLPSHLERQLEDILRRSDKNS